MSARKVQLATVWLDGCSGCHMSVLDMDEAIEMVASKVDIVYGPLVDAQKFPEAVDVTLVEGAVSSQEDMEKIQLIRRRTKLLVALGDCAVTSNVPAMRNSIPVKTLLERVYVEGVAGATGSAYRRRSEAAQARRAGAGDRQGGSARSRLPAAG